MTDAPAPQILLILRKDLFSFLSALGLIIFKLKSKQTEQNPNPRSSLPGTHRAQAPEPGA